MLHVCLTCAACLCVAVVLQGPVSISREVGEWAEFNCTVACSHSIIWYREGYSDEITENCTPALDLRMCKEVVEQCSPYGNGYMERLRIMVGEELAGSSLAVQCAGLARSFSSSECPPSLAYSFFSFLTGTVWCTLCPVRLFYILYI